MSILCATDFSEHAAAARSVAAQLAKRWNVPLHVAHSLEPATAQLGDELSTAFATAARSQLHLKTEPLRELGADVNLHVERGPADESMFDLSVRLGVQLIVVGALGERSTKTSKLGSRADRLAQRSKVPVLVVRDAEPFGAWLRGERALRIVVGVDRSQSTLAALAFVHQLRALGPCDVTAVHLYWPPSEFTRLGLDGIRDYEASAAEASPILERELRDHIAKAGPTIEPLTLRLEQHLGRLGDRVAAIAQSERADLLIVGSRPRSGLQALLEGSVSRIVTHQATMSVACVPLTGEQPRGVVTKPVRRALVATDFSPIGNAALGTAYGLGGNVEVHLVHVVKPQGRNPLEPRDIMATDAGPGATGESAEARKSLAQLIPSDLTGASERTRIHILESGDPARAICQAAERLDADVICLGTQGRGMAARALLGSVAETVLATTQRPVLLTRAPRE